MNRSKPKISKYQILGVFLLMALLLRGGVILLGVQGGLANLSMGALIVGLMLLILCFLWDAPRRSGRR